jgi:hypothetical protein
MRDLRFVYTKIRRFIASQPDGAGSRNDDFAEYQARRICQALKFLAENGHLVVKRELVNSGTPYAGLGKWINRVREQASTCRKTGIRPPLQVRIVAKFLPELDLFPISLEFGQKMAELAYQLTYESGWQLHFEALQAYAAETGTTLIDTRSTPLGRWVRRQRHRYHEGKMPQHQIDQLSRIHFAFRGHPPHHTDTVKPDATRRSSHTGISEPARRRIRTLSLRVNGSISAT